MFVIPRHKKMTPRVRDDSGVVIPCEEYIHHMWKELRVALGWLPHVKVFFIHRDDLENVMGDGLITFRDRLKAVQRSVNGQLNIWMFIEAASIFTEDELNLALFKLIAYNFVKYNDDDNPESFLELVKHHVTKKINYKLFMTKTTIIDYGYYIPEIPLFDVNFGLSNSRSDSDETLQS